MEVPIYYVESDARQAIENGAPFAILEIGDSGDYHVLVATWFEYFVEETPDELFLPEEFSFQKISGPEEHLAVYLAGSDTDKIAEHLTQAMERVHDNSQNN